MRERLGEIENARDLSEPTVLDLWLGNRERETGCVRWWCRFDALHYGIWACQVQSRTVSILAMCSRILLEGVWDQNLRVEI